MTDCQRIRARVAGLAIPAPTHPEHLRALEHTRRCASCARLWREGLDLATLIDRALAGGEPAPARLPPAPTECWAPDRARRRSGAMWAATGAFLLISLIASAVAGQPGAGLSRAGLHCVAFELMIALAPFTAIFPLARRGSFRASSAALALVAAAGACAGQAALFVACKAPPTYQHLLVFHTLPVVAAAALAAGIGYLAAQAGLLTLSDLRRHAGSG